VVFEVEPGRIELPSKQATSKLSTCLVFIRFSMHDRPKTAYRTLIFLSFSAGIEVLPALCWLFWCPDIGRRQQGLPWDISLRYL